MDPNQANSSRVTRSNAKIARISTGFPTVSPHQLTNHSSAPSPLTGQPNGATSSVPLTMPSTSVLQNRAVTEQNYTAPEENHYHYQHYYHINIDHTVPSSSPPPPPNGDAPPIAAPSLYAPNSAFQQNEIFLSSNQEEAQCEPPSSNPHWNSFLLLQRLLAAFLNEVEQYQLHGYQAHGPSILLSDRASSPIQWNVNDKETQTKESANQAALHNGAPSFDSFPSDFVAAQKKITSLEATIAELQAKNAKLAAQIESSSDSSGDTSTSTSEDTSKDTDSADDPPKDSKAEEQTSLDKVACCNALISLAEQLASCRQKVTNLKTRNAQLQSIIVECETKNTEQLIEMNQIKEAIEKHHKG